MANSVVGALSEILADTYTLTLKTQNYHWNVTGPTFRMLHAMFEEQYNELAEAVDVIAERIRALGHKAPASLGAFQLLTRIKDGRTDIKAEEMLLDLASDHRGLIENLKKAHGLADEALQGGTADIGTVSVLEDRIRTHEKTLWMLTASV